MEQKKTVLLLCPHLLQKSGRIWELMHIVKEKSGLMYQTEAISPSLLRKSFPRVPDAFSSMLNKFSEKSIEETRGEIVKAGIKMDAVSQDKQFLSQAFERKLYQDIAALKPLLPMVECWHRIASPTDKNRFRTLPCSFSNYTPGLRFQVRQATEGYYYVDAEADLNGSFFPLQDFTQTSFLLEHKNEYFILRYTDYRTLCWLQEIDWTKDGADVPGFISNVLAKLENDYTVERNALLASEVIEVEPVGRVMLSEISGQFLMMTPQFDYSGFVVEGTYQSSNVQRAGGKEYSISRDKKAEQLIIQHVESLHANFRKQFNGYYYLSFDEARKKHWFLKAFRQLLSLNIEVLGMDMLQHFRYCAEKPDTSLKIVSHDKDFVTADFTLRFGKEMIPFEELQKTVRSGQQALPLKDDSIALLEEDWLSKYAVIVKHAQISEGKIRIPKWLAISLEQSDTGGDPLHAVLKNEWWAKWKQWQLADRAMYNVPRTVNASLRIYQQKGFEWLMLLNEIGSGMFLADDMGLGKTLQTICFIASVLEQTSDKKVLIVCPASLIYNWQNELVKFAPSLSAYIYHGPIRDKKVFENENAQIVITSYGTLRSDSSLFLAYHYAAVILDESHTIKNPSSQITKVVHGVQADRRLALSGTPVMNNTFDLYSQLEFVLPGMFGSQPFFKREYADPIDRDKNEQRVKDLQKLTAPFILRRTKEQVAKDLPPKIETILWCQMEPGQQEVYEEIKNRVKSDLKASIKEQGLNKSKLQVLQGVLKLRQVCNSPALLKDSDYSTTESIKTTQLLDEIENNLSNHKALVFSQFTTMLDILAAELQKRNIPFLLLTGATPPKERDRMVQEFNAEEGKFRVFLLSLKAGNAGLNLTAADYVFLFDPWWNNAVEQQAIDRSHRIGQTKNVFAYKLICKDTIEERIMQLQQQKKNLAGALVVEEEGFVKDLTEDDIEFLLK